MTPSDMLLSTHDLACIAALTAVLGEVRLAELYTRLGQEIATLGDLDPAEAAHTLHRLQGSSASLSLARLAAGLRALELDMAGDLPAVRVIPHNDLAMLRELYAQARFAALTAAHDAATSTT